MQALGSLGTTDGSSPPEASSAAPPGAPGSRGGRPPPPLRLGRPGLPARRQHAPPSARRILLLGCTSDCPSARPSVGLSSLAPSKAAGPIHPRGLCPFLRAGSARRAAAMLMRRGWGAAGDRRGRGDEVGAPAGGNQRREAGGSAVGARPREGRDGRSQRPDLCIQNRRGPLAGAGKGRRPRRPRPAHPLAERGVRAVETSCHLCSGVAAWRAARSGGRPPPPSPPDAAARGAWVRPARAGGLSRRRRAGHPRSPPAWVIGRWGGRVLPPSRRRRPRTPGLGETGEGRGRPELDTGTLTAAHPAS